MIYNNESNNELANMLKQLNPSIITDDLTSELEREKERYNLILEVLEDINNEINCANTPTIFNYITDRLTIIYDVDGLQKNKTNTVFISLYADLLTEHNIESFKKYINNK